MAICQDSDFILMYELIGRQFILKHTLNKRSRVVFEKFWTDGQSYKYISNFLILIHTLKFSHIYELIELNQTNDNLETFIMFHGSISAYCDGILSFCPRGCDKQYYNIHLADKTITHECPYFMEKVTQLWLSAKKNNADVIFANGILIIDNAIYHLLTCTLLGNIIEGRMEHAINSNYFVMSEKINIAPGAPVTEYEYEGLYIYGIGASTGSLTKSASASASAAVE
jgi:hypothetical protein